MGVVIVPYEYDKHPGIVTMSRELSGDETVTESYSYSYIPDEDTSESDDEDDEDKGEDDDDEQERSQTAENFTCDCGALIAVCDLPIHCPNCGEFHPEITLR